MSPLHSAVAAGNIHVVANWVYANAAARTGASGFVAGDVGKIAWQQDNDTFYALTATTPAWALLGAKAMTGLSDVSISGPATKQVLRYNGSAWANAQIQHSDMSDVVLTPTPASGHVLTYNGSAWAPASLGPQSVLSAGGQWTNWTARNNNSTGLADGLWETGTTSTKNSSSAGNDSHGRFLNHVSATTAGTSLAVTFTEPMMRADAGFVLMQKWRLVQTTDCRMLVGAADTYPATMLASDAPSGRDLCALSYSSARPDTNFQFVCANNASAWTVTDTGIPIDTAVHFLRTTVNVGATSWTIQLFDANMSLQASQTYTTNIPNATDTMTAQAGVITLATAAKQFDLFFMSAVLAPRG